MRASRRSPKGAWWPNGKASVFGTEDCGFESRLGRSNIFAVAVVVVVVVGVVGVVFRASTHSVVSRCTMLWRRNTNRLLGSVLVRLGCFQGPSIAPAGLPLCLVALQPETAGFCTATLVEKLDVCTCYNVTWPGDNIHGITRPLLAPSIITIPSGLFT